MKNNHKLYKQFNYMYIDNESDSTLCLLHGSGADENDLIPLARDIAPNHNIISLRGNYISGGLQRFFPLPVKGEFDEQIIREESDKLSIFIQDWSNQFNHSIDKITFLGYSNGANMILASALLHPQLISQTVLLHPMLVIKPIKVDLSHLNALFTLGINDQLIPYHQGAKAVYHLKNYGAKVAVFEHQGGHEITLTEVKTIKDFINNSSD